MGDQIQQTKLYLPARLPDRLLPWFAENARDLPWRADREPYHVWLSEIMLQQTRAAAVRGYYIRFLEALPTVEALAAADEQLLLRLWEGLGYYSRMRNLQKAAQMILERYGSAMPDTYDAWRALPSVGDYTAGAVCSICFDQKTPAVDGNVLRVWARLTGYEEPADRPEVKAEVREQLKAVYPPGRCGDFTQALMELGATVCLPNGAPDCSRCPVSDLCRARADGSWVRLPVKTPKRARKVENRTVLLLELDGLMAFSRRPNTGLLAGQWELPNSAGDLDAQAALDLAEVLGARPTEITASLSRKHIFTHLEWHMTGYRIRCAEQGGAFTWAPPGSLPLPTAFRIFLEGEGEK